ncbi:unnamed protein product, partial [Mesorhabditis belari]|uniref:EF-hand domain-containing protein n=1 Tax=Mesorhabditis belari TaxID=2138241 RepID=A0AAF3EGX5_9BILA
MSKAAKKKSTKSKSKSASTQQTFDQRTIQEFKESFGIMDGNKDGVIDRNDLMDLYATLGQIAPAEKIDGMLKEAAGPLNFTTFLSMFGEKMHGSDSYDALVEAFKMFDPKGTGKMKEQDLAGLLQNKRGEPLNDDEYQAMLKGKPPIEKGEVDYVAFARMLTSGGQEE